MSWNTYRNRYSFYSHICWQVHFFQYVYFFSSKDIYNQAILMCLKGKCSEINIADFSLKIMFYFKKFDFYFL